MGNRYSYFGALGCSNPEVFHPGFVAIRRKVDFGVSPIEGSENTTDNYSFIAIPAGMFVANIFVREVERCNTGSLQLVNEVGDEIGDTVSLGNATLAKTLITGEGLEDEGLMIALNSDTDLVKGKIEVTVIGFMPDGDSLDNFELEVPYKVAEQVEGANVNADDLYLAKVAKNQLVSPEINQSNTPDLPD